MLCWDYVVDVCVADIYLPSLLQNKSEKKLKRVK